MPALLLAAAVTPLTDGGERLDEPAFAPFVRYLRDGGVDGVFCCGTTGEGMLLTLAERRRAAELFRAACDATLIVHAGAQSTRDTIALAEHARELGADGVAVIPPPYFPLDDDALLGHLSAAAAACAPVDFYVYAFAARSGYPVPIDVITELQKQATNLAGIKVSERSPAEIKAFVDTGLPVLVGAEPLIPASLAAGAAGAVSGLASAYPAEVAKVVGNPSAAGGESLATLRATLEPNLIPNLKATLGRLGVPVRPDVRRPLRPVA
jgi:dihydrodipicolinate synthase/N-acetylneuraminate lyase